MLDVHFVILGAAIGAVGQALYVRDTVRGDTQPNRVTWLLWAIAPLLAFAVEIHSGVGLRSLMTFMVGFGPLCVVVASFVNPAAFWEITRLDYVCGALSVLGTAGWLVTRHGMVALVAALAADGLAAVPTVVKAWRNPESESANVYLGGLANAGITLLTVDRVTTAVVAFPIYILVVAALLFVFVAGRVGPRLRASGAVGAPRPDRA